MGTTRIALVPEPVLPGAPGSGGGMGTETLPSRKEYDVVVVGGGPAGLTAASFCGKKGLRTAIFEGDSWGGILTRWCPDKRIDNYPGTRPGIPALELAQHLIEETRRAEVDRIGGRVDTITRDREVISGNTAVRGSVVILASGSTASETGILREREFSGANTGVHYAVRDPAAYRGKRVVIVGGGETALSHARRLSGIASRVMLVLRQERLRTPRDRPSEPVPDRGLQTFLHSAVEEFLGAGSVQGVRIRNLATGRLSELDADAVVMAAGRMPNHVIFRDLDLAMDAKGQVVADRWQRTNVPGILAVGDVSSHLKMIITAVAQAATAAHQACREVQGP